MIATRTTVTEHREPTRIQDGSVTAVDPEAMTNRKAPGQVPADLIVILLNPDS